MNQGASKKYSIEFADSVQIGAKFSRCTSFKPSVNSGTLLLSDKWYVFCIISGNYETNSKELFMSKNMRYLGLCSTCKDASSCTFPRNSDKPVFYCEEFEIEKPLW